MLVKRHALNRIALAAALMVCSTGGSAYQVYAQEAAPAKYKTIPLAEQYKNSKTVRELEDAKKAALKGNFNLPAISNHYKFVLFPQLTNLDDPQLANAAAAAIRLDLQAAEKLDAASLNALNKELFRYFSVIGSGDYTPAASINSVLLIGELVDERGGGSNPGKPFSGATGYLLKEAENGHNDGVKAAALVGLERHVRVLGPTWKDEIRNAAADRLLQMAMKPQSPQQSAESHAYLSARALQILGAFKHNKGPDAVAFATDILANEFTHPILREQALAIVGTYDIPDAQQAKLVAAGRYSMRYMRQRLDHWNELYGSSISAGGGGGGGMGMGPGASYGSGYASSQGMGGMGAGAAGASYGTGGKPKKEEKKEKPWEKQNEETKMLRRFMHEVVQIMRFGLSGTNVGETPEKIEKGLLSKMPAGEERDLVVHAVKLMKELQEALNDEEIESKSDFGTKDISKKVDNLIAIAEQYPGALDKENEAIVVEEVAPVEPAAGDTADAAAAPDPTASVQPAPAENPPAPPAGN
jgi:hypothetical protein